MAPKTLSPQELAGKITSGAEKVIKGKRSFLELLVCAMMAGGHVLLEDLPGTGKTTVAKTIAKLISARGTKALDFKRIQFTPDLLPYDITGVDIYNPEKKTFTFNKGPVFANIVLADEINRTTPKVQSALLEVMAENQVSIGTKTHRLNEPFMVIATQNPVETEGTWHLPEAQLDRFMMKLEIGYPDREAELAILSGDPSNHELTSLKPHISLDDFLSLRTAVESVYIAPELLAALGEIIRATRGHPSILMGTSTRAGLHFLKACKARSVLHGRSFVSDDDLESLAVPCLAHRIKLKDSNTPSKTLLQEITLEKLKIFAPA